MNNPSWSSLDELKYEIQEEIQKLERLDRDYGHIVVRNPRMLLQRCLDELNKIE